MRTVEPNYLQNITFTSGDASTIQKIGEYKGKQGLFCVFDATLGLVSLRIYQAGYEMPQTTLKNSLDRP